MYALVVECLLGFEGTVPVVPMCFVSQVFDRGVWKDTIEGSERLRCPKGPLPIVDEAIRFDILHEISMRELGGPQ